MIIEALKMSHLIGILIIAVLVVYSYYLSCRIDELKYELARKDVEINLAKSDKKIAEARTQLWINKLKETTIRLSNKIDQNYSRNSQTRVATVKV